MYSNDQNTTFKYNGFAGLDDQAAQFAVPSKEGPVALTAAVNVDIDRYQKLFRRQGFTAVYNGSNIRCLTKNGRWSYFRGWGFAENTALDGSH